MVVRALAVLLARTVLDGSPISTILPGPTASSTAHPNRFISGRGEVVSGGARCRTASATDPGTRTRLISTERPKGAEYLFRTLP